MCSSNINRRKWLTLVEVSGPANLFVMLLVRNLVCTYNINVIVKDKENYHTPTVVL